MQPTKHLIPLTALNLLLILFGGCAASEVHEIGSTVHEIGSTVHYSGPQNTAACHDALQAVDSVCHTFGDASRACKSTREEHATRCNEFGKITNHQLSPKEQKGTSRLAAQVVRQREASYAPLLKEMAIQAAAAVGAANAKVREAEEALHSGNSQSSSGKLHVMQLIDDRMASTLSHTRAKHKAVASEKKKISDGLKVAATSNHHKDHPHSAWFSGEMKASLKSNRMTNVLHNIANEFSVATPPGIVTTSAVSAAADELGETTDPVLHGNMTVALKGGKHKGYCTGAGAETTCKSKTVGKLEKFHVVEATDGYIGLKGGDQHCMQHGKNEVCNEGHMNDMQKFKIFNVDNGKIAMMSKVTGKYCSDRGANVVCLAENITPDEEFDVKCFSGCQKTDKQKKHARQKMPDPTPLQKTERNGGTSETTPETGCKFDKLPNEAGAEAAGDGCLQGQIVDHGKACAFTKPGFICTQGVCESGAWTVPKCTRSNDCFYDNLKKPAGITSNGKGCIAGGLVATGSKCIIDKARHTCNSASCKDGKWADPVSCYPLGCAFSKITIPVVMVSINGQNKSMNATSLDPNCQTGSIVASGRTCSFVRQGFSCNSSSCSQGVWSTLSPACKADSNDADLSINAALQDEMKVIGQNTPTNVSVTGSSRSEKDTKQSPKEKAVQWMQGHFKISRKPTTEPAKSMYLYILDMKENMYARSLKKKSSGI